MLKTKVVFVAGQALTLCENTLRVQHTYQQLLKDLAPGDMPVGSLERTAAFNYAALRACVLAGNPPALAEFADVPLREFAEWFEAAKELVPEWFESAPDPKAEQTP